MHVAANVTGKPSRAAAGDDLRRLRRGEGRAMNMQARRYKRQSHDAAEDHDDAPREMKSGFVNLDPAIGRRSDHDAPL